MADIKQAAKWLLEGKAVHRSSWGESKVKLHVCNAWEKVRDDLDRISDFTALELLADDWEIAE
jgi:hypothetical protein